MRLADEIESNKGSIKPKYVLAYSVLSGQPCDKGGHPYQNFSLLIDARNGLMHMKPNDLSGEAKPDGTLTLGSAPKIFEKIRGLGIIDTSGPCFPMPIPDTPPIQIKIPLPWNYRIATPAAASWACNTATDVVESILTVVPDGPHKPNLLLLCKAFKRIS